MTPQPQLGRHYAPGGRRKALPPWSVWVLLLMLALAASMLTWAFAFEDAAL